MYGILMTPNVIDIFHGNTINDFAALKAAGIVGVIHKATQGANYADPAYAKNRILANNAGLLWGAYAFNTGEDVTVQVKQFFEHAEPDDNTLMALDFEDNPHSQMSISQARQFLELADAQLGRKIVIYSGNRVKDLLGSTVDPFFGSHRLWLAQYGPVARVQHSWDKQWLWQYSENGRLPGTDGQIDLNAYDGTADQLAAEWAS
jgi:GH25 family lysozyme M1 (1,4-beta-N-acetylmuramidase)